MQRVKLKFTTTIELLMRLNFEIRNKDCRQGFKVVQILKLKNKMSDKISGTFKRFDNVKKLTGY